MAGSSSDKQRFDNQAGFVLHSYPFRETSLIVEVFSESFGRVALVARGARRPRSALRGVLLAFQPLRLAWFGKGELRTLHAAEWHGPPLMLSGLSLMCGFYVNELLLRLLARDDPHEELFLAYQETLRTLSAGADHAVVLRCFERRLLDALGYGLTLDREAGGGSALDPDRNYRYVADRGPVQEFAAAEGVQLRGKTLLDMARDDYQDPVTLQQAKLLMRHLINHHLGDQPLHTRQLLKDLQEL